MHSIEVSPKTRIVKFMFSKKATKIEKNFTVDLTLKRQIDGEDLVNFCGLLRKHELYIRGMIPR